MPSTTYQNVTWIQEMIYRPWNQFKSHDIMLRLPSVESEAFSLVRHCSKAEVYQSAKYLFTPGPNNVLLLLPRLCTRLFHVVVISIAALSNLKQVSYSACHVCSAKMRSAHRWWRTRRFLCSRSFGSRGHRHHVAGGRQVPQVCNQKWFQS